MKIDQTPQYEIHQAGEKILKTLDKFCTNKKVDHYKIFFSDTKVSTDFDTLTGIIYVFKYNHLTPHDNKVIYTDALLKFMIATGIDALFVEHPTRMKLISLK